MTIIPYVPLLSLDTLWFQVAGTICNITCTHCFISCSPTNHAHEMLSLADVEARLVEAKTLGVRDYYFTGGEPFLNRDMIPILAATLRSCNARPVAWSPAKVSTSARFSSTPMTRAWAIRSPRLSARFLWRTARVIRVGLRG